VVNLGLFRFGKMNSSQGRNDSFFFHQMDWCARQTDKQIMMVMITCNFASTDARNTKRNTTANRPLQRWLLFEQRGIAFHFANL
jgi:hypothetical protein